MSYLTGNLSDFPNEVDTFLEVYELPNAQRDNVARFQQLKLQSSLSSAEQMELNDLTIILQHYIISPTMWNKFCDALIATQQFFLDSVEPYIESKKIEFQTEVNKLIYKGDWHPDVQYYEKNIVTTGGEGYIAKLDSKNISPSNTTYWGKIASKGGKGDPSLNINYKGEYKSNITYQEGDAVTFNTLWYYAKDITQGNLPTNGDYWELHSNQVVISNTVPLDDRITGWIDTNNGLYKYYDAVSSMWVPIKINVLTNIDGTKEYNAESIEDIENDLNDHFDASNPHGINKSTIALNNVTNDKQMPIAGGTFTGVVKSQINTSYTTAQLRNVILSTNDANVNSMNNGDIWIRYS